MPKPPINILFEASGRRVSLVRQFMAALQELGLEGRALTADNSASAPAHYAGDGRIIAPLCTDTDYIPWLLEVCRREGVRLLVPLIDTVLPVLAQHRQAFAAAGTKLLTSDPATIRIGQNKVATHGFFRAHGFRTPRLFTPEEVEAFTKADLPVFVKPPEGSASIGAARIDTLEQLRFHRQEAPDLLVLEFVRGQEFTIDVYVDFTGEPRCAVPRKRLEVRAGEVSKAMTVRDEAIIVQSMEAARKLPGAIGVITLQCLKTPAGDIVFIEMNPRFGGGYPLSWHAGAKYPKWILEELIGREPNHAAGRCWKDNLCMLRYDDEIIIDGALL